MVATLQLVLFFAFYFIILVISAWALIDLSRRPATAFTQAGKLTKTKWGLILGAATMIAFISLPYPLNLPFPSFLALVSAVAAIVYLVDVKPAVAPYSRRRGGNGPSRPSGGW